MLEIVAVGASATQFEFLMPFFFIFLFSTIIQAAYADRLKDMVSFAGIRSNQLMGYGIVVGLDGTGDSSLAVTLQSMQSTISQFGMNVDAGSLSGKNSAAVMITADLDPFTASLSHISKK